VAEALLEGPAVLAEVLAAQGSTPREAGAWMLIGPETCARTIGGGRLEFMAIDAARALLRGGETAQELDVPLGPQIGQCCGGRVRLGLRRVDAALADALRARLAAEDAARPQVLVFGGGHVGRALLAALALLPVRAVLVESREAEAAGAPEGVEARLTALPEAAVRAAPPGSAYVATTHDHGLDFLIAAEALARGDAAYVGMIGSASKRAACAAFARARGVDPAALVCPIGGAADAAARGDKRPTVIAALTAAQIMRALAAG